MPGCVPGIDSPAVNETNLLVLWGLHSHGGERKQIRRPLNLCQVVIGTMKENSVDKQARK